MWYIHFRDRINGQWSNWADSSYGPYTNEHSASQFVVLNNKLNNEREYRYSVATTRGKKPGENTVIPRAKTAAEPKGMPPATTTWTPDRGPQMANPKGHCIYKYQLPVMEAFTLELPTDAVILRCETIEGKAWIWVMHDLRTPKTQYNFRAFKTGGDIPDDVAEKIIGYVGHYTLNIQQELCLYVFQVEA